MNLKYISLTFWNKVQEKNNFHHIPIFFLDVPVFLKFSVMGPSSLWNPKN